MIRRLLVTTLVTTFLLATGAFGQDRDRDHDRRRDAKCEHRIRKAEQNLDNAVRRHGEHSRQAEQKRRNLEQVRASCRGEERRERR